MQQQFASPVEQIVLAGFHMRSGFVILGRSDEFSSFLLNLTRRLCSSAVFFLFNRACTSSCASFVFPVNR